MKPNNFFRKFLPFLYSHSTYTAFGVEESPTKFPLSKSRFLRIASYIHEEYLKRGRPIRILDIGCNDGTISLYCQRLKTPVEFFGIDILPEKREACLKRGYRSVALEDIRNCPFDYPENFFNIVICSHILEHLEEPAALLKKLNKILQKDGLLLASVPAGPRICILWRQYVTPLYNRLSRHEECRKRFGHVSFFTLADVKKLFSDNAFKTEAICGDYFIRARGFFLENYQWWFDFNQWCGKVIPSLCGQVTLKSRIEKPAELLQVKVEAKDSEATPVAN